MSRVRGGKGTLVISNAIDGTTQEFNTLTCCHCNRVVVLNPDRKRARGWCRRCNHYVCDHAACNSECNPILEGVELAQAYAGKPEASQPFLLRGPNGEPLFDTRLRDRKRIAGQGFKYAQAEYDRKQEAKAAKKRRVR